MIDTIAFFVGAFFTPGAVAACVKFTDSDKYSLCAKKCTVADVFFFALAWTIYFN